MSQYKSMRRTKPRLTMQATLQSQSAVSVSVCTIAFPGRRLFPLQVLQMLDTSREVCQPLVWPSLCRIFTHVGCTRLQIQKKMRARGCRRLKEKCKQDKAIRNPDFPTKSSKLSWLLHKVYLITVFHNNKYLVLILWKQLANIHMEYSLSKNSN